MPPLFYLPLFCIGNSYGIYQPGRSGWVLAAFISHHTVGHSRLFLFSREKGFLYLVIIMFFLSRLYLDGYR